MKYLIAYLSNHIMQQWFSSKGQIALDNSFQGVRP
jgi:hypothetical protein